MPMIRWRPGTLHWSWEQRPCWRTSSRGAALHRVLRSAAPWRVMRWTVASLMFALVLLWWRLSRPCLRAEDPWCSEPTSSFLSRLGQSNADHRRTCFSMLHDPSVIFTNLWADVANQIHSRIYTEHIPNVFPPQRQHSKLIWRCDLTLFCV